MAAITAPPSTVSIFQYPPNFPAGVVNSQWITWFNTVQANTFVFPAAVAGYAIGWDALGNLVNVPNTGADQTAVLADTTLATNGAGRIGYNGALSYATGTVGNQVSANVTAIVARLVAADASTYLDQTKGAALIGFNPALTYPGPSVGSRLNDLATASGNTGASLIGYLAPYTGAVGRTQHSKNTDWVSVKDFGAVGDGVTDDTAAIQAAFDWLHTYQNTLSQFANFTFLRGCIFFPDGNYKISAAIKVRAFVAIRGVGTGYLAGSALRQVTANTNIFEFYEANTGGTALGSLVEGMRFEFDRSLLTTNTGVALCYPKNSDNSPFLTLASNSHYIKNNHFGGWHSRGSFIKILNSNDVEITGNIVDVCTAPIAIQIGDQTGASQCSDVRITQNNFYSCYKAICVYGMITGTIHGNNFSNSYIDYNSRAISLVSNGAITTGYNTAISVTGNTFWRQNICFAIDGSAKNVVFSGNVGHQCNNAPIVVAGGSDIYRATIAGNTFQLSNTNDALTFQQVYANTAAIIYFDATACIYDSVIADNTVDANTITTVTAIANDQTTSSFFKTGNTLRNNIITNNAGVEGANETYLPCKSWGLTLDNVKSATQLLPVTALPVLSLTTFNPGDSVSFDLDYEVKCEDTGLNIGGAIGRVRVAAVRWASGGTLKSVVTVINTIGDDYNSGGGGNIPTVTFAVTTGSPATITCTVAAANLTSSTTTTITVRASNFLSNGTVGIKST